jgi:hypothetical protein
MKIVREGDHSNSAVAIGTRVDACLKRDEFKRVWFPKCRRGCPIRLPQLHIGRLDDRRR